MPVELLPKRACTKTEDTAIPSEVARRQKLYGPIKVWLSTERDSLEPADPGIASPFSR